MSSFHRYCGFAVLLGLAFSSRAAAPTQPRIGMELWTYRVQLAADTSGTLATIRRLGFTDIETGSFYGRSASEFRRLLESTGLTCSGIIVNYDRLKDDLPAVIADAKALGARYVVTAGFPHKDPLTAEDVDHAAVDFNAWGAELRAAGFQFGYHPHGFEFVPAGKGNLFDRMLARTSPELVTYELDTYHFLQGGADPLQYLKQHPRRFALVHLKDMAKGTPIGPHASKTVGKSSVVLGMGILDWPPIFAAAKKAGVKVYYVEDESPAAPVQVLETIAYLKSLKMWEP